MTIPCFYRQAWAAIILAAPICFTNPVAATDFEYSWGHPSPQGNTVFGLAFANAQEGWAVGGSGFVLHTQDSGVHWALQHGPLEIAPDLYDVLITPSGTLIACGAGDALFRSVDAGDTWTAPPHPPTIDLRDLSLVPGGSISAAGDGGVVLRSADDGLTWTAVGPGVGTIRHHVWRTATEGYVVGQGISHRTTNGGATWTEFIPAEFLGYNEVFFTTALQGYVLEDFGFWDTTNGGVSWTEHFTPVNPLYRFRTLVLTPTHWLLACHGEGGELWETTDAGENWTLRQMGGAVGFPCIVQAPGGRVFYGSDTGDLFRTDNFGLTVENATLNYGQNAANAQMRALYSRPDGVLFAANQPTMGENPAWLRSDDGGHTWTAPAQSPGLYWALVGGFFDNQRGMVGYNDLIRATFDGGGTWLASTLPSSYRIADVAMPAVDRYFVAAARTGSGGGVFRSTDGGLTWSAVGGGLPTGSMAFTCIAFPTPTTGFVAGSPDGTQSRLYRTLDGGTTWQIVSTNGIGASIRSMNWFDSQHGVASLGFDDPGIHRTVDGGLSWTPVTDHSFVDFVPRNATQAAAVPLAGDYFLRTNDSGATWEEIHAPLSGPFPGLTDYATAAVPTADGWVLGGGRNKIMVAREVMPASAPEGDVVAGSPIAGVRLSAEPNPVLGKAIFHIQNPIEGHVRLDIFDARGARVATLLDTDREAGPHSVAWNGIDDRGRSLPEGTYFAKVRTVRGVASAKLTLIR